MRTLRVPNDANGCFRDPNSFAGVVTTNSMVYSPGSPAFDRTQGSLDYRVTSPHLTSRGEKFLGTYDLAILASTARCVYGFSSAPVSATVPVISADGNAQVATANVAERGDWIYLAAAGFTFSSPTVRVTLSQAKTTATSSQPQLVVKSVVCTKGNVTKKVAGAKCPKGWKKN